jgi:septum formation protein
MGLPFNIMPALIDETHEEGLSPREIAENLATRKVHKIVDLLNSRTPLWICGADTIISVDGNVFGKPLDRDDAQGMLVKLQGRDHEVVTAVALFCGRQKIVDCRSVTSTVSFVPLREKEIEWYLNTGEWQGVAGGYRIQGLAACFISGIRGSFSSIVGLPLHEFYAMLIENGYPYGDV